MAGVLPYALAFLAIAHALRGEFLDARATAEEGLRIAADTGVTALAGILAAIAANLAAITGDEQTCHARAKSSALTAVRELLEAAIAMPNTAAT